MNRRGQQPADPESSTRYLYYWLLVALFVEYARPASYIAVLRIPFLYSAIPLLLLVVSSFAPGLRSMREIFSDRLAKWVPIFLGLIGLSLVHAEVSLYVVNIFNSVLGYAILFLLIARIATTAARMRGVFLTLLVAHLFLLAMNPQVVLDPNTRHYIIGATFLGDGNDFALSLCALIPCVIAAAVGVRSTWAKVLAWAGLLVAVLAIVGTQSRGATLGLGAVLFYLWLRSPRKMLSLAGVAVVAIGVLIYAPPVYFERIKTIGDYEEEGSAVGRITAWKAGTVMALKNPVLGVGAGHFAVSFGTKYRPPGAEHMPWLTAHSSYFLVLGELSFPGIVTFLILVFGNMRANARTRKQALARAGPTPTPQVLETTQLLYLLNAAVLGFAVAGAFLSAAYYPHVFVLTALGICARSLALEAAGLTAADVSKAQPTALRRRPRITREPV